MVFSYKEALEEVKDAERMLNYAVTQSDIDNAINLLSLNMDKLDFAIMTNKKECEIVSNMDSQYIQSIEPINENPTLLEKIKGGLKNVFVSSKA